MSKEKLMQEIANIEAKLDSTADYLDRGPVKDAIRLVVPMMKDQLAVLKMLVEEMEAPNEQP